MASKDPFRPASRWRMLPVPVLAVGLLALVVSMGLVSPVRHRFSSEDLHKQVVADFYRLQHAVTRYVADTGAFPPAVADLTGGAGGGLSDKTGVPLAQAATWRGPYLSPPLARPARASSWSLAEPCCMNDRDGDGAADELWCHLQRGDGAIDDTSAAWLDRVLDDGVPDRGSVRVTPTQIGFELLER